MALQFHPAQRSDMDTLLAMMADFYHGEQIIFNPSEAQIAVKGLIQTPHYGGIWLIQLNTQTIGYLAVCIGYSLEYQGPDAFLDEIYLQPTYRSQGIGTQAISFVERVCRERGIHALHLEVEHHNPKARKFYEKTGYVLHNRAMMTKWL